LPMFFFSGLKLSLLVFIMDYCYNPFSWDSIRVIAIWLQFSCRRANASFQG
jgi:hypothetical protein